MLKADLDTLLDLLEVRLDAFAMCEIERACSLVCPPLDGVVVHFVLRGEGAVSCEHGVFPLKAGSMIVVPRRLEKTISGLGPILKVVPADAACPMTDGIVRFRACEGEADLVLGCASVEARVGEAFGLFDHLAAPLVEESSDPALAMLFEGMLAELSQPKVGTRALVGTMMKHVLILLLRAHMERRGTQSPLYMPLMNPQLGKALVAIVAQPQAPHSLESLARLTGMSRSRFTHHFTATYGRSPMHFVQSVRLRAGGRLLRSSGLPIKSIAAAVGYASRSHFSRAFRAEFGVDPTGYREGFAGEEGLTLQAAE
jgi:AraC-like DNA-binding protein